MCYEIGIDVGIFGSVYEVVCWIGLKSGEVGVWDGLDGWGLWFWCDYVFGIFCCLYGED